MQTHTKTGETNNDTHLVIKYGSKYYMQIVWNAKY